jgi:hypothetical protein
MRRPRKVTKSPQGRVIAQVRKPFAPPLRVEPDTKKYRRSRERARISHEEESS